MAKIISICNQKGGVGKTTSAINISAALAHYQRRVLLVDMDPQGNASQGLGFDISLLNKCVLDVLNDKQHIKKVIKKTDVPNLDLLPSKLKLASMDDLDSASNKYFILKDCLSLILDQYDYIIIDCPPSFGFLTLNALVASNTVLIPVQCEYFAMAAISQMLATISKIQATLNSCLSIEGFLLTMYDAKTNLDTEITIQVRSLFKENTFLTQIPRNISIPESNQRGEPVIVYRPTSSGALAYLSLAKEIIDHETI
ncbi:MAG: ParA family protein [Bacilli bacterium]|nr:ParA family protein [Bacilli bacterium]